MDNKVQEFKRKAKFHLDIYHGSIDRIHDEVTEVLKKWKIAVVTKEDTSKYANKIQEGLIDIHHIQIQLFEKLIDIAEESESLKCQNIAKDIVESIASVEKKFHSEMEALTQTLQKIS
jgi:hypothetical protein